MSRLHIETHLVFRVGWLRAAVLGANDGIVSTASLIIGVAAAAAKPGDILLTGIAGLVAGAMSMAAGEYVSVSSQADTEQADLARETAELAADPVAERSELAAIYVGRLRDGRYRRRRGIVRGNRLITVPPDRQTSRTTLAQQYTDDTETRDQQRPACRLRDGCRSGDDEITTADLRHG